MATTGAEVTALEMGAQGRYMLALSAERRTGRLLKLDQQRDAAGHLQLEFQQVPMNDASVSVALSPTEDLVADAFPEIIRLQSASDQSEVRAIDTRRQSIAGEIVFSQDGMSIAADTRKGITFWPSSGAGKPSVLKMGSLRLMTFSPDSKFLAGADYSDVFVLDAQTGAAVYRFEHDRRVHSLAFSPDGKLLAVGTREWPGHYRNYTTWDGNTQKPWRPEPPLLIPGSLWNLETGEAHRLKRQPETNAHSTMVQYGMAMHVCFSPDGTWLVTSTERSVRFWHLADLRRAYFELPDEKCPCGTAAFSPDGNIFVTAGRKTISAYDFEREWLAAVRTGKNVSLPDGIQPDVVFP